MFQAYALPALIGLEDPGAARDLAHRVALREAMTAAGCRRPFAGRVRSFLATGRRADLAACRA
ncbi:MAG TPA: hypothetical protein VLS28_12125 [Candidatus Sulfomarinibacteraceae bacterium]|nr:hypothetical protein [Candidatus Sulfomarinibacteraceae bacterium]